MPQMGGTHNSLDLLTLLFKLIIVGNIHIFMSVYSFLCGALSTMSNYNLIVL